MTSQTPRGPAPAPPYETPRPPFPRPVRLWPAVVLVVLFWSVYLGAGWIEMPTSIRFFTKFLACLALPLSYLIWWLTSRAVPMRDRLFGLLLVVLGLIALGLTAHKSVANFPLLMVVLPAALTVSTLWLLAIRKTPFRLPRVATAVMLAAVLAPFALLRVEGINGDQVVDYRWRWSATAEQLFRAERTSFISKTTPTLLPLAVTAGDSPAFLGPDRDGIVHGQSIRTDWNAHPPKLLWKHRVGSGWSSISLVAGRLFTQEQRDQNEAVVCYDAATGSELWSHEDSERFWDDMSGAGPRATPTFADGRVYAQGTNGLLTCLDAGTGRKIWSRDVRADAAATIPMWGYSGSPLIIDDLVVAYGGDKGKGMVAYHRDNGSVAWMVALGEGSYASPQLATLAGVRQILMFDMRGLTAVDPKTGAVLWRHDIPVAGGSPRNIQPHTLNDSQVLVASEADLGTALIDVSHTGEAWNATRKWTSRALKPSYNDFVTNAGFAYGFDSSIFTCIDLQTGKRRWREGSYGHGQVLLVADQSLLLVISETGEAILVRANPDRNEELGRFQAINGKTWNHPTLAHGRLYVRNGEEMACYEIGAEPAKGTPADFGR